MKILITGASGFIGRSIIKNWVDNPDFSIFSLSRDDEFCPNGVTTLVGDVLDMASLEAVFSLHEFDIVIHLAAITAHKDIVDNKYSTLATNLQGTMNVLDCFNRYCKNAQFIYTSTGKVYGNTNEMPISEKAQVNPTNILGKSKYIAERLVDFYAIPENKYLICRIFNIFGENQKKSFVIPTILEQIKEGHDLVLGNLEDKRDYLYVDDLVSGIQSCIYHKDDFANVD